MKKITVDNYEAFFLDYIEGNLDEATKLELESFLLLYPHLKDELDQAYAFQLTPKAIIYDGKDALKKFQFENMPLNRATFADFCIAAYEGLLSENKKEELAIFMQADGTLLKEYITYGKTILKPEMILYPAKDKLYREVPVVKFRTVYIWGSVAAGLALLIGIYTSFFNERTIEQPRLVQQISPPDKLSEPKIDAGQEVAVTPAVEMAKPNRSVVIKAENPSPTNSADEEIFIEEPQIEIQLIEEPELASVAIKEPLVYVNADTLFDSAKTIEPASNLNNDEVGKHKLLALVEEGVEKINKVTQSDNLALAHKTSPSGKIKSFSIKLGFIGFERKKGRN